MTLGEFRKATQHLPAKTPLLIRSGKRTATEMWAAQSKLCSHDGTYYWLDEGKMTIVVVE